MTSKNALSYEQSGVSIDTADAAKRQMAKSLATANPRVMNSLGAFASLYDFRFPEMASPVLVVKMEEPGSKQLLAAQYGRLPAIGHDLVNHIINDTIVMGAKPLLLQDTIICGKLEKDVVVALVDTIADACRTEGCDLVGGETSEQPRVVPPGTYILSACCIGVVDRAKIIDGSKIEEGDVILAVASSGVHTNGYTLVRSLLDQQPGLAHQRVGDSTFLEQILIPHRCYNHPLQQLFSEAVIHGLAHITGGGLVDNLSRIIPQGLQARVDLRSIEVLEIFRAIAKAGNVAQAEMLRTFNLGVGLVVVAPKSQVASIKECFESFGHHTYPIGTIMSGDEPVSCAGSLLLQ
ncbi:MAG: phosphoribosylformylglycinamidine cyclo-ligase [Bdellovibrionota bacterium]|nr:MAG: phosphoribosylformylglycinamidine cyclo-ligase [Bdellovibrionota bacterium]